ncbi:wd40 repeat protein [Anaeramoeba flamelloides]|uniref:Wd40 repeat protein n=1 Tax=Anaeramoeba flamelloides TaxID=1746091 RepID=A0ABQ8Z3U1_9EUKA|nr:wd40 repeat protein [Anaeramoeba flamelloides]
MQLSINQFLIAKPKETNPIEPKVREPLIKEMENMYDNKEVDLEYQDFTSLYLTTPRKEEINKRATTMFCEAKYPLVPATQSSQPGRFISCVRFDPLGSLVCCSSTKGKMKIFDFDQYLTSNFLREQKEQQKKQKMDPNTNLDLKTETDLSVRSNNKENATDDLELSPVLTLKTKTRASSFRWINNHEIILSNYSCGEIFRYDLETCSENEPSLIYRHGKWSRINELSDLVVLKANKNTQSQRELIVSCGRNGLLVGFDLRDTTCPAMSWSDRKLGSLNSVSKIINTFGVETNLILSASNNGTISIHDIRKGLSVLKKCNLSKKIGIDRLITNNDWPGLVAFQLANGSIGYADTDQMEILNEDVGNSIISDVPQNKFRTLSSFHTQGLNSFVIDSSEIEFRNRIKRKCVFDGFKTPTFISSINNGCLIASPSKYHTMKITNLKNNTAFKIPSSEEIICLDSHPSLPYLVAGMDQEMVKVFGV